VIVAGVADLTTDNDGLCVAVTDAVDAADVTAGPVGGVPEAVAELPIEPALKSAAVAVYDAVQVVDEVAPVPAAVNVVDGHVMLSAGPAGAVNVSATETPVRVTLPVLLTTNE
jgi:hypothetical protein